jgi:hypothetical protein
MKKFSEQFYKKSTTVKLRAVEKDELRERLVAYMEYHPMPVSKPVKNVSEQMVTNSAPVLTSEPFTYIPLQWVWRAGAAFAVLVLIVVPVLAERSVPGDTLYAIKQVNEDLRGTLIFDSYQKVEWETERLNRRIAEARLLASEGKLTEEVEAEVVKAVQTHTENAKKQIEVLREVDADEATMASIALDTTLEVQSASLRGQEEEVLVVESGDERIAIAAESRPTNLLADAIDASRDPVDEAAAAEALPAYPKLMARVEQNTTRIYELRAGLVGVEAEEIANIDRRMEDIERAIAEAMELSAEDEETARTALVEVLQRTQKLIVFMTEIELSTTMDIESLVPVVLTEEEKAVELAAASSTLAAQILQINVSLQELDDEAMAGKVGGGLEELASIRETLASTSLTYIEARILYDNALALAKDSLLLLETAGALVPIELPAGAALNGGAEVFEEVEEPEDVATSSEKETNEADEGGTSVNEGGVDSLDNASSTELGAGLNSRQASSSDVEVASEEFAAESASTTSTTPGSEMQ